MTSRHYDVSRDDKISVSYQSILLSISDHIRLSAWKIINPFISYWSTPPPLPPSNIMILSCRLVLSQYNTPIILMHNWDEGRLLCLLFLIRRICYHWQQSQSLATVITQLSVKGRVAYQGPRVLTPEVLPGSCLSHHVIIVFISSSLT